MLSEVLLSEVLLSRRWGSSSWEGSVGGAVFVFREGHGGFEAVGEGGHAGGSFQGR